MAHRMSLLTGQMVERKPAAQAADLSALLARIEDLEAREAAAMNRLVAVMVEREADRMVAAQMPAPAPVIVPPVAVVAPTPAPVAIVAPAPRPVAPDAAWSLSVTARDSMTAIKSLRIVSGERAFVMEVTQRDALDQILNMTLKPE